MIALNALFAIAQERQAVRAVEALRAHLPEQARVMRDGREQVVPARELVPGDVLLVEEGERVSADARLLDGAVDVGMSTLTGESLPVSRYSSAQPGRRSAHRRHAGCGAVPAAAAAVREDHDPRRVLRHGQITGQPEHASLRLHFPAARWRVSVAFSARETG